MNVAGRRHVAVARPSGKRQLWLSVSGESAQWAAASVAGTNGSQWMGSKLLSAKCSSEASFPSKSVRRASHKDNVKSFIISLLLLVSFLTLGALMLMHRPQKVDAFLNSDEPVESKHVVTSGMIR
jgi:hypothetical protein